MARAIIHLPKSIKRGELVEIKAQALHVMETGFRRTQTGEQVPRDIITRFACSYNGNEVFSADFYPSVAANPFISFFLRAADSGSIVCIWIGDNGFSVTETAFLSVG